MVVRMNGTISYGIPVTGLSFSCVVIWIIMPTVSQTSPLWLTGTAACFATRTLYGNGVLQPPWTDVWRSGDG